MYRPRTVSVEANRELCTVRSEEHLYTELLRTPGVEVIPKPYLPEDFKPATVDQIAIYRIKCVHEDMDFDYLPLNITALDLSGQDGIETLIGNWLPLLTELNLTGCTNLRRLNLYGCSVLKTLKLEGCINLTYIDVRLTGLSELNLNDCPRAVVLRTGRQT